MSRPFSPWLLISGVAASAVAVNVSARAAQTPAKAAAAASAAATNEIRAAELIAGAKQKLKLGQFESANNDLRSAKVLISDPVLRIVWNATHIESLEAIGQWAEAAYQGSVVLKDYAALVGHDGKASVVQWNPAVRSVLMRTIKNYFLAGLSSEAFAHFDRRKFELSREMLTAEEEVLLKRIANELRSLDRENDALTIERIIFKNYPFVSQAVRERLTADTVCRLDTELSEASDKRVRASGLIQRLGADDDIRSFTYSLMGVPAALRLITAPIDVLSGQTRSELLDLVEWLHSVREYNVALDITNRLILSQNFEPPFTRERLIMLHARNLNGVHRPVEAAAFYRGLILQYPETEIANTARPRYVLSLHYAQKYTDVAREAASLAGLLRQRDVIWRTFWARYLGKQYSLAISATAHESSQEQFARLQYWRGRALEADGLSREAKEAFKKVVSSDNPSHYGLLASWRLDTSSVQPVSIQKSSVALAAKSVTQFDLSETTALRSKSKLAPRYAAHQVLIEAGAADLMRGPMRKRLQSLGASGGELAELLAFAGDAHAGVQFAQGQRKIVGSMPLGRGKDWKNFLAKNADALRLLYPRPYRDLIADTAQSVGISPWLILGIMRAESLFQPTVVSSVGARGLMQIMPTSGARIAELIDYPDFEPAHLDRPEVSIAFGGWYLARLLTYYRGNLPIAIAAYNAGPEAVDRWIKKNPDMSLDEFLEDIPFDQTRKYVATVLTNMELYSRLYSNGVKGVSVNLSSRLPNPRNDLEIF